MTERAPSVELRQRGSGIVELRFAGDWRLGGALPSLNELERKLSSELGRVYCSDAGLGAWDSSLPSFLLGLRRGCELRQVTFELGEMPPALGRLLALATAVKPAPGRTSVQERLFGPHPAWREIVLALWEGTIDTLAFLGAICEALLRLVIGRATVRRVDLLLFIEQAGPGAIGIITLISVLVGMILAYLGSVQLQQFGAQIYVADLVGIGMVREMGALMTAVIMAGRTGAAYAAQLGSMQANEEVDAITTLGIPVMEFLVLPRVLALVLVMPLLCLYADVLGMFGGALVAAGMEVSFPAYMQQIQEAVSMTHILTGLAKSVVFGLLIALAGCRAGIQSGRSSAAVGQATTRAVVDAIVFLIVADAAFNIVYQKLGI